MDKLVNNNQNSSESKDDLVFCKIIEADTLLQKTKIDFEDLLNSIQMLKMNLHPKTDVCQF